MMTMTRKLVAAGALALLLAVSMASAQQPQIIRGTIDKIEGSILFLKQGQKPDLSIKLLDNATVLGVKSATIADVKPGAYIGVAASPQPDGSQKAIAVTIFSELQRGVGEGFRPWHRPPGSTMTNGTAASTVTSVKGEVVTVKYKGGEQKIIIGPAAKFRMYVVSSRAELKPGDHIAAYRPKKAADGTLETARINVGLGGMTP
jgi:hypothetical protein